MLLKQHYSLAIADTPINDCMASDVVNIFGSDCIYLAHCACMQQILTSEIQALSERVSSIELCFGC